MTLQELRDEIDRVINERPDLRTSDVFISHFGGIGRFSVTPIRLSVGFDWNHNSVVIDTNRPLILYKAK